MTHVFCPCKLSVISQIDCQVEGSYIIIHKVYLLQHRQELLVVLEAMSRDLLDRVLQTLEVGRTCLLSICVRHIFAWCKYLTLDSCLTTTLHAIVVSLVY